MNMMIQKGSKKVARVQYEISGVIGDLGAVCPYVCGDVWPEESSPGAGDCGDAIIDIFDILEEVDIVLTEADSCQAGPRSDVPTGTPPYCLDPDGVVNILDVMVIIDMVLQRQDCCSYWYAGIIYQSERSNSGQMVVNLA